MTALAAVAVTVITDLAVSEPALLLRDRFTAGGVTTTAAFATLPGEPISEPSAAWNAPLTPIALKAETFGVVTAIGSAAKLIPAALSNVCPAAGVTPAAGATPTAAAPKLIPVTKVPVLSKRFTSSAVPLSPTPVPP